MLLYFFALIIRQGKNKSPAGIQWQKVLLLISSLWSSSKAEKGKETYYKMFHGCLKYKTHNVWIQVLVALEPQENSELDTILRDFCRNLEQHLLRMF